MIQIMNHDVAGLCHRINRYAFETKKSQSANVSSFSEFEAERLRSYLNALRTYHSWVMEQPLLDLPESAPEDVFVRDFPEKEDLENESASDLYQLLKLMYVELVNSQSARLASGLMSHDSKRFTALVDKAENFLNSYVSEVAPLDLPESSPRAPMSGHGNRGVLGGSK